MQILLLFTFQIVKLTQKNSTGTIYEIIHNLYNLEDWNCLWKLMPSNSQTQLNSDLLTSLLAV